ncbi:hypothetical protein HDU85_005267 [Gaertneriomyces sp. JEL0708]|nr:hypothetical protein HDU85_005267 [Gaertneriomyces sp. JEL0708]
MASSIRREESVHRRSLSTPLGTAPPHSPDVKPSPSADSLPMRRFAPSVAENPFEQVLENEHPWTILDIGANAISGIMNDPNEQKKSGLKISKGMDNLPIIPPTPIRKVATSEFEPYMKSLGDVYARYQLNRVVGLATATEGTPILATMDEPSPSFANFDELTSRLGMTPVQRKPPNSYAGMSAMERNRLRAANLPPLATVPTTFMEPEFNLSNPHTFAQVCDNANITMGNKQDTSTANAVLQEKLSHYLDTIELHLIKEISRRSSSFFAALSNLQALHEETHTCVEQIQELRKKLGKISQTSVRKGLDVVRLKRRRANLNILHGGVKLVAEIRHTQPMIQILLGQGDYVAALDMIEHASMMLQGREVGGAAEKVLTVIREPSDTNDDTGPAPQLDLRRVGALNGFSAHLANLSRTIGTMMENEFVKIALSEVREAVATLDVAQTVKTSQAPGSDWVKRILGAADTLHSINTSTASFDTSMLVAEERLKGRLSPLVLGLLRMDRLGSALQLYKDSLLREIKLVSKKHYPVVPNESGESPVSIEISTDSKTQQQSALARHLRSMSPDAFYELLLLIYITLLQLLQRVAIVHGVIVVIVKESQSRGLVIGAHSGKGLGPISRPSSPEPPGKLTRKISDDDDDFGSAATLDFDLHSPAASATTDKQISSPMDADAAGGSSTYGQMISESSNVLFVGSDLAHVRCAKLIGVRSEQNSQLSPADFFKLYGTTWEFIAGGEALCGRMCFGLKGTLISQAKTFINRFHEERSKQVAHLVETEQWTQSEVPADFQQLTNQFLSVGGKELSTEDRASSNESIQGPAPDDDGDLTSLASVQDSGALLSPSRGTGAAEGKSQRHLIIDGQKYNVVACVLLFLKMLTEYIKCMESIPGLTTEVLNRIAEILKLFNSRTCQVILGAGAMRSAGLKNISAKHIALAAQVLGVVIAVMPHLKEKIKASLPPKQQILLGDFDRLLRDYKDHQGELYGKLLSIMEDFCLSQCERLQNIKWDEPEPSQFNNEEGASVYMVDMVRQTATLHKVLNRYLPSDTMKSIMNNIFKLYNHRLGDKFKDVDLFSGAAKNRLLIDVQYLIQKLSALDGVDGPGNHLEVLVNNTKIKDKRAQIVLPLPPAGNTQRRSFDAGQAKPATAGGQPPPPPPPKKSNFASAWGNMLRSKTSGEG